MASCGNGLEPKISNRGMRDIKINPIHLIKKKPQIINICKHTYTYIFTYICIYFYFFPLTYLIILFCNVVDQVSPFLQYSLGWLNFLQILFLPAKFIVFFKKIQQKFWLKLLENVYNYMKVEYRSWDKKSKDLDLNTG